MSDAGDNIVHLPDVELAPESHGELFVSREARLGPQIGARQLGCTLIVVPPGKRSCPFHSHRANEELFLILEGCGTLRYGPKHARNATKLDVIVHRSAADIDYWDGED